MARYNVVKKIYGNAYGTILESYDNIEDARNYIRQEWAWIVDRDTEIASTEGIADDASYLKYDNYIIEIEVEEEECEPFEAGTSYPCLFCDEQGNNKWVDYADGSDLCGLSSINDFAAMGEAFQEQILDNTQEHDREAIINGQVWVNADRTVYAILYGE